MDLNVKGAETTRIAEGNYSILGNAQNVGTKLPHKWYSFPQSKIVGSTIKCKN